MYDVLYVVSIDYVTLTLFFIGIKFEAETLTANTIDKVVMKVWNALINSF